MVAGAQSTNDRIAADAQRDRRGRAAMVRQPRSRPRSSTRRSRELEHKVADAKQHADTTAVAAAQHARSRSTRARAPTSARCSRRGSALDSVRRAELLDRANAESERVIDEFTRRPRRSAQQRASLEAATHRAGRARRRSCGDEQAQLQAQLAALQGAGPTGSGRRGTAAAAKAAASRPKATPAAPKAAHEDPRASEEPGPSPPSPAAVPAPAVERRGGSHHDDPFLVCTRARESHGNYGVVSASGKYYGAYQFAPTTWDITASHAGRVDLVGVRPNQAGVSDQDELAWALYQWQGKGPWGGRC